MMAAVWLLSVVIPIPARAQTREAAAVPSGPLTLEQVLSLAEPRSEGISIAAAAVRRAEADQIRARSGRLPQLSAAASYDRSLASEFDNVFNTGGTGSTCPPLALNPQAALDARVAEIERAIDCGAVGGGFGSSIDGLENLPFGRRNTWRASLSFSQSLWSGGRNGAQISLAGVGREFAQLGLTTARAQLLYEVTQAYYDAVLSDQLVNIAAVTSRLPVRALRRRC